MEMMIDRWWRTTTADMSVLCQMASGPQAFDNRSDRAMGLKLLRRAFGVAMRRGGILKKPLYLVVTEEFAIGQLNPTTTRRSRGRPNPHNLLIFRVHLTCVIIQNRRCSA